MLYKQSLDRSIRRAAYEAEASYFDRPPGGVRLHLRQTGQKTATSRPASWGYRDYSELSYIRMNRIGYGPREVAAFRQEVADHVVPMLRDVMAMRAKRVGLEHPMFWDGETDLCRRQPRAPWQL